MSNPFAILSVDRTATKRDILVRVAAAMREGRYETRVIAEAQKTLFDPGARAVAEFEYVLGDCGRSSSLFPESIEDGKGPMLRRLC